MFGPVFNYQGLSKDYFLLIYQNLGADFRAPKSGYRSQKRPVLPPLYIYIYKRRQEDYFHKLHCYQNHSSIKNLCEENNFSSHFNLLITIFSNLHI